MRSSGATAGSRSHAGRRAFFIAFPTASGALAAAQEAQRALAPGPISVRIGIHTGEPTVTAGDYVGMDVHRGVPTVAVVRNAR